MFSRKNASYVTNTKKEISQVTGSSDNYTQTFNFQSKLKLRGTYNANLISIRQFCNITNWLAP